jgi:O-antigen ligase
LTTWFITYLLFYYFNNEKNKVILMCILGGGGFLLLLAYSSTVATRFSQEDVQYNLDAKWNMMMAGLTLFLEKPIIGYGYNGYYENFSRFFKYSWEKNYDAHNEYVTALASYGIIGFIWFVSLFLTPFFDLLKRVKFNKPNTQPKTISVDRQFHIMGISLIPPIMMSTFYAGALFKQPVAVISFFAQVAFALAITKQNKE